MSTQASTDQIVKYGDFEINFATVPHTSLMAVLRRGASHIFGNEVASKVTGYFDPDRAVPEGETKLSDTPENRAMKKVEFQKVMYDALLAGTLGVSTRGPSIDPIQTVINRIARKEVVKQLKDNGVKPPKKADDTVKTPSGDFTLEQLVKRRLDPTGPAGKDKKTGVVHVERITAEAKKEIAEQARKAKKVAETVKDNDLTDL